MTEYRFIPEASLDYQEALEWYQNRSERAANGFAMAVEIAMADICRTPGLWPYYDDSEPRLRSPPLSFQCDLSVRA